MPVLKNFRSTISRQGKATITASAPTTRAFSPCRNALRQGGRARVSATPRAKEISGFTAVTWPGGRDTL